MSKKVQIRRGTAAQHETFIGAEGEITMDTTNKTLRVHDGVTPGGTILAKQGANDYADCSLSNLSAAGKQNAAAMAMPSSKYINITMSDSTFVYTAPANGYVLVAKVVQAAKEYIALSVYETSENNILYRVDCCPNGTNVWASATAPIAKGQKVKIEFTASGATRLCRFVYAQGDK